MRKLIMSEFVSLDGVMEAPDHWHLQFWHDAMGEYKRGSDGFVAGRSATMG
ncbi:MAG: hypothetical protein ACRDPP_14895 [Gaiellaceae bacterium]